MSSTAEPNYIIRADATVPNEPLLFGELWGLRNLGQSILGGLGTAGADISATLAWDVSTGSRANVIAVIDTGIDYTHADLAANVWSAPVPFSVTIGGQTINCAAGTHGFDAIAKTCDPWDDHGHGTHVAGTIGAVGNNNAGVAGVNWTASIMASKFLDENGVGTTANSINAIQFVIQAADKTGANVRVLSNSWSGGGFSQLLLDEINTANTKGMLFVASAGNLTRDNDVFPHYPSGYDAPNVIAVAATDNTDTLASVSNYGASSVDLAAPGVNILSTWPGGTYRLLERHIDGRAARLGRGRSAAGRLHHIGHRGAQDRLAEPRRSGSGAGRPRRDGRATQRRPRHSRVQRPGFLAVGVAVGAGRDGRCQYQLHHHRDPVWRIHGNGRAQRDRSPSEATASFTPTSVTTSGSSTMTITSSPTTPTGTFPLTITGTSDSLTHTIPATLTITGAGTTTSVASDNNPSTYGAGVTFTATVSGPGTPTGTVTFLDGTTTLQSSSVDASGQATWTTSALAAGARSITAVYEGDGSFDGSTSPALSQVVNPAALTVTANSPDEALRGGEPVVDGQLQRVRQRGHGREPDDGADRDHDGDGGERGGDVSDHGERRGGCELHDQLRERHADGHLRQHRTGGGQRQLHHA